MERTPGRVLVIVPTYNERENLPMITRRLREALPDAYLLVADDNSPDGTGRIADELAEADDHIHVLHRTSKQGWAPPTSPDSTGAWPRATTCWWRWTPTAPTSPRSCTSCSTR
ncbi:hypothetical protein GCM10027612_56170 [Microbispora bryophytorum subsp. camponoti]